MLSFQWNLGFLLVWMGSGLALVICLYYLWFYLSFRQLKVRRASGGGPKPFVSVIICAKNAGPHLLKTVALVLNQNYPAFEVIVVDDFSTDDSFQDLDTIEDNRLILLKALENQPGKKAALTTGIWSAQGTYLLMTDADCLPATTYWIESMVEEMMFNKDCEIVLGYGPLLKNAHGVNLFARFETSLTAMQYITYAERGMPYMGVGRNIMYKKDLWQKVNGFEAHSHIIAGDDDLFIMQAAHNKNTRVQIHPDSFVYSDSKTSWRSYFHQKSRHISTSVHYRWVHKIPLLVFAGSSIAFWTFGVLFLVVPLVPWPYFLGLIFVKWSLQIFFSYTVFKKLQVLDLLLYFPILDMALAKYYVVVGCLSIVRRKGW